MPAMQVMGGTLLSTVAKLPVVSGIRKTLQSSTWRELRAIRMVLMSFESQLQNERVHWFTDNQNVVRIVLHGSKKPILQKLI